jgi:plasmid maintenance system killer protein
MHAVELFEELNEKGFPPSLRLHRHSGPRRAEWAIDVHKTGGWRITFLFEKGEFTQVKVEDYH